MTLAAVADRHRPARHAADAAAAAGDDRGDRAPPRHAGAAPAEDAGRRRGQRHGLAEKLRLPYSVLDALIQHAPRREAARGPRHERRRHRPATATSSPTSAAIAPMQFFDLCRYVGPAPVPLAQYNAYVRACMAAQAVSRTASGSSTGFEQPRRQQGHVRSARAGGELRQVAVPLRRARQRQDGPRRRHRPRATATRCTCRTRIDVDGQTITMYDPVSHQLDRRRPRPERQRRRRRGLRSPLGAHRAAGGRRRRRADARDARPDVQPDRQVLRSADPDEGQRRRVRRRRLRPAADSARATC